MTQPNHRNGSAEQREIKRLQSRVLRYAKNIDYYAKYPDSAALQLNREMLDQDLRTLNLLTDAD